MVMAVILSLMIVTIILGRNAKEVRARHYLILFMLVMIQVAAMVINLMFMGLPPPLPKF
jgi:hypothetical protein